MTSLTLFRHVRYIVDHRYSYDEFDPTRAIFVAHYTCGLARNAVAAELRANNVDFADKGFLNSLPKYINNPSMTGFMIEQAVISWIAHNGLDVEPLKNKQMTVTAFEGDRPNWQTHITKNLCSIILKRSISEPSME